MNLYLTRAGRLRRQDNTLRFETVSLPPEEEHADPETESWTSFRVVSLVL